MSSSDSFITLQERLGYKFRNIELLKTALTHRSFVNESLEKTETNERFEFLGDSILAFLVGEALFRLFPRASEGILTRARAHLVGRKNLANISRTLGIGDFILLGKGARLSGSSQSESVLADALEALIAAVYLDSDLETCRSVVFRLLRLSKEEIEHWLDVKDNKTRLQELSHRLYRTNPIYTVIAAPPVRDNFIVQVKVNDVSAQGEGRSKSEAEQEAARKALDVFDFKTSSSK